MLLPSTWVAIFGDSRQCWRLWVSANTFVPWLAGFRLLYGTSRYPVFTVWTFFGCRLGVASVGTSGCLCQWLLLQGRYLCVLTLQEWAQPEFICAA